MTKQEAANRIIAWFSKPAAEFGWDADKGQCVYLTDNGARCAVGILIPEKEAYDELARMSLGGIGDFRENVKYHASGESVRYGEQDVRMQRLAQRLNTILSLDDMDFVDFLTRCQRIHDKHAETFATQSVPRYMQDTFLYSGVDYGVTPKVGLTLEEAKEAYLAEFKEVCADEYGLVV